uniref:Killer toxin Kp4 domain-containing protein n=1 Tax=Panagrolaimus superbus TaxID=310955 RepID=A0A914Z4A0_9BILA
MFKYIFLCSIIVAAATGLGINCRGSFYCWRGADIQNIKSYMDGLIDNNRDYNSGENIVCYRASEEETIQSGFCLFLQNTKSPVKGGRIFDLLNHLIDHGCKGCGSVPIDFPESNDPGNGILTMNYVGGTGACIGLC